VFHEGHFIPKEPCDIPDGAEVHLTVEAPSIVPPRVGDLDTRKRIIAGMIERMHSNRIPSSAPRMSREEMHDRR